MHHEQCLAQVQPAVGRGLLKRTCAARSSLAASSCTIAAARGKPFPVRYSPSNAHPRAPGYREPSAVRQCGAHARTAGRRCRRRTRRGRALSSERRPRHPAGRRDLFRTGQDSFSPGPGLPVQDVRQRLAQRPSIATRARQTTSRIASPPLRTTWQQSREERAGQGLPELARKGGLREMSRQPGSCSDDRLGH